MSDRIYKVKEGLIFKKIDNEYFAVPVGSLTNLFRGIITLNKSSADIWPLLVKGSSKEQLISSIREIYDVQEEQVDKDITILLNTLEKHGLLE
jgi:hypothetical protein